jgi:hypothetical protein
LDGLPGLAAYDESVIETATPASFTAETSGPLVPTEFPWSMGKGY